MIPRLGAGLFLILAACGCATLYDPSAADERARADMTLQTLQLQVEQLQTRVQDMETQRQDLYDRMQQLESRLAAERHADQERLAALEGGLAGAEATRQRDREQIVDELSRKMATVVSAGGGSAGTRSGEGYEHVVQPGETLSAIAAAYKVKASVIAEANNLKKPDSLRVGQKLFIPE